MSISRLLSLLHLSSHPTPAPPEEWVLYLELIQEDRDIPSAFQTIDIYAFDSKGLTAIHAAAILNKLAVIQWLLDQEINIDTKTQDSKSTPLHLAARHGKPEAVQFLLDKGADASAVNSIGSSPLHYATSREIITTLMTKGADINARNATGKTPLHCAVMSKNVAAIRCLLALSPGIDIREEEHYNTPLHIATFASSAEIVAILLQAGADPSLQNKHGFSPFHIAAEIADSSTLKVFVQSGADVDAKTGDGTPPLLLAVSANRIDNVSLLLESGVDTDAQSSNGLTAFHCRKIYKSAPLVSLLLRAHASTAIKNNAGFLPIHIAAQYASVKTMEEFLGYCSDINSKADNGRTALHIAAACNRVEIISLLIDKHADMNSIDSIGGTPLIAAICTNKAEAAKTLLEKGANTGIAAFSDRLQPLHIAAKKGFLPLVELLLDYKAEIDAQSSYERTPLHLATAFGHTDIIYELLRRKANVRARDTKGYTSLHLAALIGEGRITYTLIKAGADINAVDESGNTSLHLAASRKHLETAITLLTCDTIDRERKNNDGKTPLCIAAAAGDLGMFSLLRSNGASTKIEYLPHAACEGGNLDIIKAIFDKDRFQKTDSEGRTPLMIALLHHSSQIVQFLDSKGMHLDPDTLESQNIIILDRWHDFQEAECWDIGPSLLSWTIPQPEKPSLDLLSTWEKTLKTLESDTPSPFPLTDEKHPWYGLNRIVTRTVTKEHEGIAGIPSDPAEKRRFFDRIGSILHYIFTAGHSKDNLCIYCQQLDDSGRNCGENWLHNTHQVYIQATRDLGDLPDPPPKEAIQEQFSDRAAQTALIDEATAILLAAHDLQQRAFEREVIRYAGPRNPSDAHTIGLCARAFGDLFPLLRHQDPLTEDVLTAKEEVVSLSKHRDEVQARLDRSCSPCNIFWLARDILLKNRDSDASEVVGWEYWDKAQSGGTIDEDRRSKKTGLLTSEALAEYLAFLGMITPKQNTYAIS